MSLLLVLFPSSLFAATRLVTTAGVDAGNCTVAPCATLSYAIGQAIAGDSISVAPGTYNNGGASVVINKTVTVDGAHANVDARTRAFPDGNDSILTQGVSLAANNAVLNGFTVNCAACAPLGAGVLTNGGFSGIQVLNNVITGNQIGIFPAGTAPVMRFNRIFDNNTPGPAGGTGIYTDTGLTGGIIDRNLFSGHTTAQMNLINTTNVQVIDNTFTLDTVDDANAVVLFAGSGTVITGNVITGGAFSNLFLGGGDANVTISGNTISGGVSNAISASDVGAGFGANGLITITSNTITNNLRGVSIGGGNPTPMEIHLNRLEGNGTDIRTTDAAAVVNGESNWFGCNAGPTVCGVLTVFAGSTIDVDPWLVLGISASPNPITIQQTSSVTADLTRNSAGAVVSPPYFPNGTTINFSATGGTVAPPSAPTNSGQASTTFTPTAVGPATASSTLDAETVTVNITVTKVTPAIGLNSSLNPSTYGQAVTFTATLPAGATGSVQFQDGGANIGAPVPVGGGGTAQLTTSTLTGGTHSITAVYSGDAVYNGVTSAPVSQVVNQATPAVTLVSSVNPSSFGQAVTFTATVPLDATGTIQFQDNGVNLGAPVAISGGSAQFTTSTLTVGTHPITAVYSGDINYTTATSNTVNQVVNAAGNADLGVTGTSAAPAIAGSTTTVTYTITNAGPSSAFNTTLSSTIPAGATVTGATSSQGTCTIGATVDCAIGTMLNAGTATVTLNVTLPPAPGTVTFTGTVSSTSPDPNATNNSASVMIITIAASAIPALDPRLLALLAMAFVAIAVRMMR